MTLTAQQKLEKSLDSGDPQVAAVTVGVAAVKLCVGAATLAKRAKLIIFNNSASIIYLGPSTVTVNNGRPLLPNGESVWYGDADLYAIAAVADLNVRVTECL